MRHKLYDYRCNSLFMMHLSFIFEEDSQRMKLNELGWQKVERQTSWQQGKRVNTYSDLFQAEKREPLIALDSYERGQIFVGTPLHQMDWGCSYERESNFYVLVTPSQGSRVPHLGKCSQYCWFACLQFPPPPTHPKYQQKKMERLFVQQPGKC